MERESELSRCPCSCFLGGPATPHVPCCMDHAPRAGGQVGCRATERPVVTVAAAITVVSSPASLSPASPVLWIPQGHECFLLGKRTFSLQPAKEGPCLSSTSLAPTPTGGRWTQRAAMLRGLPILPAQPRSWTLPALAWQEGICGPRVSIPAASPPPVSLGAGGLASLSLLPRPLRLHSVCWPLCPKTSLHPLPQLGPTETTQGLWPLGLGRSGSLGMECSARRLGQCLLGTPSVLRKALAREGESQVGRMSSQHGQQRFPALAFPLPISFFSVAH